MLAIRIRTLAQYARAGVANARHARQFGPQAPGGEIAMRLSTVCIFVEDQDRAKAFYRDKLGFEVRADDPLFPGSEQRWLAVAPPGNEVDVILYRIDANWEHYRGVLGRAQAVTFEVDDIQAAYDELRARGVDFRGEPRRQHWGAFATLIDSEGNELLLTEPGG